MPTYPDAVAALDELRGILLANRDEAQGLRRVTPEVGAALAQRGFGRLSLPLAAPGHELDPMTLMAVLEGMAEVDPAAALVVFNNCLPALVSRHLDDDSRAEIFADRHGMYANSTRPSGRAVPTDQGYLVSGRWTLVTGCHLANWLAFMTLEWDVDSDRPKKGEGPPLRMVFVPASEVEIIDTWDAVGVRGSGSHDVALDQVEVPPERVIRFDMANRLADRPLGRVPWMTVMAATHGSISTGIARAATAEFLGLMDGKRSTDTGAAIAEHPGLQLEFLDAHEACVAARDRLRSTMARVWEHSVAATDASTGPATETIADVFGAARLAATSAKTLTEVALRWGGTAAVSTDRIIERAWRDVHTVNQHVLTGPVMAEQAGRVRLGLAPKIPSFTW